MYGWSGFAEKSIVQNGVNSIGNCVHYMHGLYGFVEKLNIQNGINSREIVYIICTQRLDLQKN